MEMETEIMASHNRSLLRSPEKVDLQVPDSVVPKYYGGCTGGGGGEVEIYTMDELEGILNNIKDEDNNLAEEKNLFAQLNCDFMNWEGFSLKEEEEGEGEGEPSQRHRSVKREKCGFWVDDDDDEYDESSSSRRVSLNLSLNYQEVLDAWSDRGSLWADDYSHLSISNNGYVSTAQLTATTHYYSSWMGEVPVMKEDKVRREARVLRYKEKRHNRLFSKKIRYEVRKLNADKRPRLKGRFVKRTPEKTLLDKV